MHRLVAPVLVATLIASSGLTRSAPAQNAPNAPGGAAIPTAPSAMSSSALGLELSFLVPRGDFTPGGGWALGYGLRGAVGLGPRGMVDVGAAFRSIAHDSHRYSDSVEVKNMLRTLSLSGRVSLPVPYVRPYVGAAVGAAYFGTETMVERCCNDEGEWEWELDDFDAVHFQPTASTRLGLLMDLSPGARGQPVFSLDLGLENHYGRRARYQVGGRGEIRRSGSNYRVYSLGVTVRSR